MTESMHEFVVRRLQERGPSAWDEVADASGVPRKTLEKVARRTYKSHRISTIEPLAEHLGYFEQFQRRRSKAN